MALISWKDRKNGSTEYFLIDDPVLRQTYGPIIGQIAHSHWWPLEQLAEKLPRELGAPGGFANDWSVDPVKLACLLRTADASHLDERRAPGFLRTLRKPFGIAAEHWAFQEKLYQPRLEADRLVYTSKSSFAISEASAWWTCFDALQVVDRELRQVDSLFADTKRPRLAARGVSYVEEPGRLAKLIGTSDWYPVDAKIKVGDVARLIGNLGGEQLYGHNLLVPLRELIQNASDAVRARRLLEGHPDDWGDVYVRNGKDDHGQWIEVEDNGIGMSAEVLTGPFLDFSTSFWGTSLMHDELPGLEAKGFSSTGKFGIGFFSVFMWGNRVQVVTRRPEKAREDTLVLEFSRGLTLRPLLRKAQPAEYLREGGTRVRVWLKQERILDELVSSGDRSKSWTMELRCAWLCPSIDVNLTVEGNRKQRRVVRANDWITLKGSDLLKRIAGPVVKNDKMRSEIALGNISSNLLLLNNQQGEVIGRACVFQTNDRTMVAADHNDYFRCRGLVTVGGFRSSELTGIPGILIGRPHTASRDVGIPVAEDNVVSKWASEQADLISNCLSDAEDLSASAQVIRSCGGDTANLPIAVTNNGWVSAKSIAERTDLPEEVIIVQDAAVSIAEHKIGKIELLLNVFVTSVGWVGILQTGRAYQPIDWPSDSYAEYKRNGRRFNCKTLEYAIIEAVAKAWGLPVAEVLEAAEGSTDDRKIRREIGTHNKTGVTLNVTVITVPKVKLVPRAKAR